ncbi:MAG: channel protein hemolysin family [Chloroflexi bacterium]|nr:channel protein hemolysin family [Chloroflexota bacterium]
MEKEGVPQGSAVLGVPRLRGVIHQYAFFAALLVGATLIILASSGRARTAVAIYAAGLAGCLGTSALYHRGRWSPRVRAWLCRLDHSMIFVLIAGTYTPVCMLALSGTLATAMLVTVWVGAVLGIVMTLVWWQPPAIAEVLPYIVLGWVAVAALPQLGEALGWLALLLLFAGGALYTVGAVIYGLERPDPFPAVFGYHEVFHCLTIAAAGAHLAVVTLLLTRA